MGGLDDFKDVTISEEEFVKLMDLPSIIQAMQHVGIDIFGLIDLLGFIFRNGDLLFVDLMQIILQLRSSAEVTVRDIVELRKFLTHEIHKTVHGTPAYGEASSSKGVDTSG